MLIYRGIGRRRAETVVVFWGKNKTVVVSVRSRVLREEGIRHIVVDALGELDKDKVFRPYVSLIRMIVEENNS